jgi:hypothetical protein
MQWLDITTCNCNWAVGQAEEFATAQGGWSSARHEGAFPTADFEVSILLTLGSWISPHIYSVILPTMARLYQIKDPTQLHLLA